MHEILFRGKRVDNGRWVEGFYAQKMNPYTTNGLPIKHFILDLAPFGVDVLPETVGQYTGLTDKKGVKIFEGDIIECWSEGVKAHGTVQQRIDGLWIIYPAWQKHIMWGLCPDNGGNTTVEVIGNIHDNPELLETAAKPIDKNIAQNGLAPATENFELMEG